MTRGPLLAASTGGRRICRSERRRLASLPNVHPKLKAVGPLVHRDQIGTAGQPPGHWSYNFIGSDRVRAMNPSDARLMVTAVGYAVVTVPVTEHAGSDLLQWVSDLGGAPKGIPEELLGPAIMDVRYDSAKAARSDRPSYFTNDAFPSHTDLAYVKRPPRFLLMYCLSETVTGGEPTVSDCRVAWRNLDAGSRAALAEAKVQFRAPPNALWPDSPLFRVHSESADEELFRFRFDSMLLPKDLEIPCRNYQTLLDAAAHEVALSRGDLMIVDNHRFAHGRRSFSTDSGSAARHLLRTYADVPLRSSSWCSRV